MADRSVIALCLGGAPSVWDDLKRAEKLLGARERIIIACNDTIPAYEGHLDAVATHHPEKLADWRAARAKAGLNTEYRVFVAGPWPQMPDAEYQPPVWDGTSGLFCAQVAILTLGCAGAIVCGVPLDAKAGHIARPGEWTDGRRYRSGWRTAMTTAGGRLRSMCGWTRDVLGAPTDAWLTAVSMCNPPGRVGPQPEEFMMLHRVTNNGDATARFNGRDEAGELRTFSVDPGKTSDPVEINPDAADFVQQPTLSVKEYRPRNAPAPAKASREPKPEKRTKPPAREAMRPAKPTPQPRPLVAPEPAADPVDHSPPPQQSGET